MGLQIGSGDQTRASHSVGRSKGREGEERKERRGEGGGEGGGKRRGMRRGRRQGGHFNDFPNLAQGRMRMAALEVCSVRIWLSVPVFIGRESVEAFGGFVCPRAGVSAEGRCRKQMIVSFTGICPSPLHVHRMN